MNPASAFLPELKKRFFSLYPENGINFKKNPLSELTKIFVALLCSLLIVAFVGILELIAGLVMVGIGIEKLFSMPMGAFAVMGFGLVNIGVALLLECIVFWLYGVAIPSFFKKINPPQITLRRVIKYSRYHSNCS